MQPYCAVGKSDRAQVIDSVSRNAWQTLRTRVHGNDIVRSVGSRPDAILCEAKRPEEWCCASLVVRGHGHVQTAISVATEIDTQKSSRCGHLLLKRILTWETSFGMGSGKLRPERKRAESGGRAGHVTCRQAHTLINAVRLSRHANALSL